MNNQLEIKQIPFMGADLMAARDNSGQIWAGIRWMCDGMGLSEGQRKRQIANIQADRVLSKGGSNLVLPTSGGNQETLCLKLDFVPLWLAKISITPAMESEAPALAENLEQYQLRAKDILAAAFLPVGATSSIDTLSPQLQLLISMELKQKEHDRQLAAVNQRVDGIREIVALSPASWREDCRKLLAKIAQTRDGGGAYQEVGAEAFKLVNERGGVSLETRLTNKRRRMADEGQCLSKRNKITRIDVIAEDKKLIEIYIAIVKEMAVKYGTSAEKRLAK